MDARLSEHKSFYEVVRPTTIIESARLNSHFACDVTLASETFQHPGSFKFRAAYHLAKNVPNRELGKTCTIVMPDTSSQVKVDAIREHGGVVDFVNVRQKSRSERVLELAAANADA